jgi:enoyl-CoA hydratase/carnithine racemase
MTDKADDSHVNSTVVSVTRQPSLATVWLNRPEKRNALSSQMLRELTAVLLDLGKDPSLRVVIVRGCGEAFSAGIDIAELGHNSDIDKREALRELLKDATEALCGISVPTLAAVNGACMGGGLALAMACDMRIADYSARLSVPAARLGVVYPASDFARLIRLVGVSTAKSLLFTADVVDAAQALTIRLVDEALPLDLFEDRLAGLCSSIIAGSMLTQQASKALADAFSVNGAIPVDLQSSWETRVALERDRTQGL